MKPEKINKMPINRTRRIIFTMIIILCLIAIGIAIYNKYYSEEKLGIIIGINDEIEKENERVSELKANFNSIFDNTLTSNQNINLTKLDNDKDIIYNKYTNNGKEENYTLNVTLPYINLNSSITDKYNSEIERTFLKKAEDIIAKNSETYTVYSVTYKAYIIEDILSLIIRAELKEGNNSQRVLIKTYNYNVVKDNQVTIKDILDIKNVTERDVNKKIKEEIEQKNKQNEQLIELGYNMYTREYSEEIYSIDKTTEFFIDDDSNVYLVYPYGNKDYTSELDLVIL